MDENDNQNADFEPEKTTAQGSDQLPPLFTPAPGPSKPGMSKRSKIAIGTVGTVSAVMLLTMLGSLDGDHSTNASSNAPVSVTTSTPTSTGTLSTPYTPEPEPTPMVTPEPVEDTPSVRGVEQENAVEKAQQYLDHSAFSRSGLIEQLEHEGFTHSQAVYGVNAISPNWNEQAAKKAQRYLDYRAFSRSGLIEQLEHGGFTHSEAVYGANKVGL